MGVAEIEARAKEKLASIAEERAALEAKLEACDHKEGLIRELLGLQGEEGPKPAKRGRKAKESTGGAKRGRKGKGGGLSVRQRILHVLNKATAPMAAGAIYEALEAEGGGTSKATVYTTLNGIKKDSLVDSHEHEGRGDAYALNDAGRAALQAEPAEAEDEAGSTEAGDAPAEGTAASADASASAAGEAGNGNDEPKGKRGRKAKAKDGEAGSPEPEPVGAVAGPDNSPF
jgi:DNA-binding PadR family transcriptional regulator